MFDDLTIVIKTILRYDALDKCIKSFKQISNDFKILVIDDTPLEFQQHLEYDNVNHNITGFHWR
jgi:hypothetical protein